MKCTKCNTELIIESRQVGIDNKGLPIIHRIGICQDCGAEIDFDKTTPTNKKTKKKDTALGTTALVLSLFGCTTFIAFILALIDLGIGDKEKKHTNAKASIIICLLWFVFAVVPAISSMNKNNSDENSYPVYNVGDTHESDSIRIKFLSSQEYIEDNEFLKPKEGNIYYKLSFEIENLSKKDMYISASDFNAYADGYSAKLAFLGSDDVLSSTLSQDKKIKGNVYFEIPDNTKELLIEYKENVFKDEKITFKAK